MLYIDPDFLRQHRGVNFVGVSTVFFCHDGNGSFVMSKRSAQCRDEQGKWEIAGGALEWGLTLEENVRRELKEEFGATARNIEFMGHREVFRSLDDGAATHWLVFDYAVEVNSAEVKLNEPNKADDLGWFTLDTQPTEVHSQHSAFMDRYHEKLKDLLAQTK